MAAGTGVSMTELAYSGAFCVAADFSTGMLYRGRELGRDVPMIAADGLRLPFRDNAFDAVTVTFGLRNVHDATRVLIEMARVTCPGGRLVICDFSTPSWRPFRTVNQNYLPRVLPLLAKHVSSNPEAYVYLAESIPLAGPADTGQHHRRLRLGRPRLEEPHQRHCHAPQRHQARVTTVRRAPATLTSSQIWIERKCKELPEAL